MRQWLDFADVPERVVDADPGPSPTYPQATPHPSRMLPSAAVR